MGAKPDIDLPDFARPAIAWKEAALGAWPMNAMPPTVRAWRGGLLLATIVAPEVDKDQGYQAAHLARQVLRADRLVAAFDTFMKWEERDGAERVGRRPGEFQRMFADAYTREREEVMEAITVIEAGAGPPVISNLPFMMDEGPPAKVLWHAGRFLVAGVDREAEASGPLVRNLAAIVAAPIDGTMHAELERMADEMGVPAEARALRQDRGAFAFLRTLGFRVEDHVSPLHPELLGEEGEHA